MVDELKRGIDRNSQRIDRLFEMRKEDDKLLERKVENIIEKKIVGNVIMGPGATATTPSENETQYIKCRRSVLIWPVVTGEGEEAGARNFLKQILGIPPNVCNSLKIELATKKTQTRRSKIHDEVLVRFETSHYRDVVQSYASNLSSAGGNAGLRMEIPDHLRGIFRLFEAHAAALKAKFGTVKRSISSSLVMDVKLDNTEWHRISADEIVEISKRRRAVGLSRTTTGSGLQEAERRVVLMIDDEQAAAPIVVVSDDEEKGKE